MLMKTKEDDRRYAAKSYDVYENKQLMISNLRCL